METVSAPGLLATLAHQPLTDQFYPRLLLRAHVWRRLFVEAVCLGQPAHRRRWNEYIPQARREQVHGGVRLRHRRVDMVPCSACLLTASSQRNSAMSGEVFDRDSALAYRCPVEFRVNLLLVSGYGKTS